MIDLFNSRPEYDVLHAALHGKYDAQGGQDFVIGDLINMAARFT